MEFVLVAIIVFLALMMLVPLWRTAVGARLARARAVEIRTPLWIPWTVGLLTGAAVLTGGFLGGAGNSASGTVLALLAAVLLAGYMMWRAGFRRGVAGSGGAEQSRPNAPRN
jgi:ABC-type glycerol-3-phosphate transport system permease component